MKIDMKKLLLLLMLAFMANLAQAGEPPATYMELKAQVKNTPVQMKQNKFIKRQVVVGVATGAAIFALNEYFIRSGNEAFHSVMPYVAIAYGLYQGYSILRGSAMGSNGAPPANQKGLTLLSF